MRYGQTTQDTTMRVIIIHNSCCYLVTKLCQTKFLTAWTAACQASLSFTISRSLLKLMSTELVVPTQDKDFRKGLFLEFFEDFSLASVHLNKHLLRNCRVRHTARLFSLL